MIERATISRIRWGPKLGCPNTGRTPSDPRRHGIAHPGTFFRTGHTWSEHACLDNSRDTWPRHLARLLKVVPGPACCRSTCSSSQDKRAARRHGTPSKYNRLLPKIHYSSCRTCLDRAQHRASSNIPHSARHLGPPCRAVVFCVLVPLCLPLRLLEETPPRRRPSAVSRMLTRHSSSLWSSRSTRQLRRW